MPLYLKDKLVSGTGAPGKSAYEAAVEAGYTGTETTFNEALSDVPGHIGNTDNPHGVTAAQVNAYTKGETDTLLQKKADSMVLQSHIANTENPHRVTAAQAGAVASTEKGAANGVATLGDDSLLAASQRPKAGGLYRDDGKTTLEKSLIDLSSVLSSKPNPNLLDNWYFGNPVNQRGQTSYAAMGYTVDRWKNSSGNTSVLVTDSGLTMVGGIAFLTQKIEDSLLSELDGKIITMSSLWTDNVLQTFSWVLNKSQSKLDNDGLYVYTHNDGFFISRHIGESQKTVKAAKLELGSQQTLAHQDANGNWVLNELPNYADTLARCQRYFYAINTEENPYAVFGTGVAFSGTKAYITVPIPVKMRVYPAITKQGSLALFLNGDYTAITVSAIAVARGTMQGLVEMEVTASGLTPGATYYLAANTDATGRLFFNSDL